METTEIAESWLALWNGDLSHTPQVVAPGFVSHAAPLTGGPAEDNAGRELLDGWVGSAHQMMDGLRFTVQLGPFRDGDTMVIRWRADGTYRGGLPGTTAPAGTPIVFYGTDTLRIEDGLIAEYWANADSLWFVQQLGLERVPALAGA